MSFLAKGKQALFHNIFDFLNWLVRNASQTYSAPLYNTLNTLIWAACGKAPKVKRARRRKVLLIKWND